MGLIRNGESGEPCSGVKIENSDRRLIRLCGADGEDVRDGRPGRMHSTIKFLRKDELPPIKIPNGEPAFDVAACKPLPVLRKRYRDDSVFLARKSKNGI